MIERSSLRSVRRRNNLSRIVTIPAPVGGLNLRDSIADMPAQDALTLNNYFPQENGCQLRGGTDRHCVIESQTAPVESLLVFSEDTEKMLAVCDGAFYDVSSSGTISLSLIDSLNSSVWDGVNFKNYLFMLSGNDTPLKYDGSTITTTTITGSGLTPENLRFPWVFKERIFMIEKNTLNAWYLGTAAIAGAAHKLDFSGFASEGGYLVAGGTWTRDGGSGSDDLCVFVTNRGQVLVYQGTDPSSANTWALVGVFKIGNPIGNRPLIKFGGDLIIICSDGFIQLSKLLPVARIGAQESSLSSKIYPEITNDYNKYSDNFGWEGIFFPEKNKLIFNIPKKELIESKQYVCNATTKSWCSYSGINAFCFCVFNGSLFFGSKNGFVVEAEKSNFKDDNLASTQAYVVIQGDINPAFNYFGSRTQQKIFTIARPVFSSTATFNLSTRLNVDFSNKRPISTTTPEVDGTPWGSPWGSPWSGSQVIRRDWITTEGIGYSASLSLRTLTSGISISLKNISYGFKSGGFI